MKIDLYTKGILTVIAFSLVIIVAKDIVPINKASAHDMNGAQVEYIVRTILSSDDYMNKSELRTYLNRNCVVDGEDLYCYE